MGRHNRPVGDEDLTGARDESGENVVSGGAGYSGSGFASTGELGGMRDTADGVASRDDDIDMVDEEVDGLTDMMEPIGLGDVVADTTDSDVDGSALDGPGDPDDRPQHVDAPSGVDLTHAERPGGEPGVSGASSARSPRLGEADAKVGSTEEMRGSTGGQAGSSR